MQKKEVQGEHETSFRNDRLGDTKFLGIEIKHKESHWAFSEDRCRNHISFFQYEQVQFSKNSDGSTVEI